MLGEVLASTQIDFGSFGSDVAAIMANISAR